MSKFYLSYWSGGYLGQPNQFVVDMCKLSALYLNEHYGECSLITDTSSKPYFEKLPFKNITTELDILNGVDSHNWALGKLQTYKLLSERKESFIHIDYDVFLLKKIPEETFNCDLLVQNKETNIFKKYELDIFNRLVGEKYHFNLANETDTAYNVGIFGGNNLDFINFYATEAIKFTLDPKNKKMFKKIWNSHAKNGAAATVPEQYYLKVLADKNNINVKCLLDCIINIEDHTSFNDPCKEYSSKLGYVHLMSSKNEERVIKAVYSRLKTFETK